MADLPVFFFSHSGADRREDALLIEFQERLARKVEAVRPSGEPKYDSIGDVSFVDWQEGHYGQDYGRVLAQQIAGCRCFVAVLSPTFFNMHHDCLLELEAFLERTTRTPLDLAPRVIPILWQSPERFKIALSNSLLRRAFRTIKGVPGYETQGIRPLLLDQSARGDVESITRQIGEAIIRSAYESDASPLASIEPDRLARIILRLGQGEVTKSGLEILALLKQIARGELAQRVSRAFEGFAPSESDNRRAATVFLNQIGQRSTGADGFLDIVRRLIDMDPTTHRLQRFLEAFQGFTKIEESGTVFTDLRLSLTGEFGAPAAEARPTTPATDYPILIAVEQPPGGEKDYRMHAFLGADMAPFELRGRDLNREELCVQFSALLDDVLLYMDDSDMAEEGLILEVMLPSELLADEDVSGILVTCGNELVPIGTLQPLVVRCWDRIVLREYRTYPKRAWKQKSSRLEEMISIGSGAAWVDLGTPGGQLSGLIGDNVVVCSRTHPSDARTRLGLLRAVMTTGTPMAIWPASHLSETGARKLDAVAGHSAARAPHEVYRVRKDPREKGWPIELLLDRHERIPRHLVPNRNAPE